MRLPTLSVGGWTVASCLVGSVLWACSSDETNPFSNPSRGGAGGSDTGGSSGATTGGTTGGSTSGGSSGSNSGGDGMGGTSTGGTTGDGGAAADAGTDTGGTATGGTSGATGGAGASGAGMGGAGNGGSAGTGGAGMGGAGTGGAGMAGAGTGGGKAGSGGMPGNCTDDDDCGRAEYCKKASCNAMSGNCQARGLACRGDTAAFEPVCGCDGITYWNTCVIEYEGFNIASPGECTGNDRPTCTREDGGDSCPPRENARCYRPVDACGDTSPTTGVCWVVPTECPQNEEQTQRYCGGTAGSARCIGFCEVIEAENSFRRDSPQCEN